MTQSNPGNTELRYNVRLQPLEPDVNSPLREPGELWVNSQNLTMYVFTDDLDSNGTPGWVGVTSGQNVGSIIYSGDTPPTLADVYPNLDQYNIDFPLDPLPGTVWYDTSVNALKIWYVQPSRPRDLDENGDPVDPNDGWEEYSASWISVTTSHYLTEATADLVSDLQNQVVQLTDQVAQLEQIINGGD